MIKRLVLAAACTVLLALPCSAQQNPNLNAAAQRYQQTAIQINDAAGNIHSLDDARKLVDLIANEFADELPPQWATAGLRDRIARAEFESATSPSGLIPEQRVADAWNRYMEELGAPDETRITVAELHNMRDAYYTTARILWKRGERNIWALPNIYAVGSDGKVADGCRAIEAIEILDRMNDDFETISAARNRVQKGMVVSNRYNHQQGASHTKGYVTAGMTPPNPIETAEQQYISEQGVMGISLLINKMIDNLFP